MVQIFESALMHPELLIEPDCAGRTPLMRAAQLGIPRLCQALLAARANVNAQAGVAGNGWTALHYAATGRSAETCRTLLDKGARVAALSFDGCTPFHYAYRAGDHIDIMQLLHARGARPDMRAQNAAGTADWGYLRYAENGGAWKESAGRGDCVCHSVEEAVAAEVEQDVVTYNVAIAVLPSYLLVLMAFHRAMFKW